MQEFSTKTAVPTTLKELKKLVREAPPPPSTRDKEVPALLFPYKQLVVLEEINETILQKIEQGICWQWPVPAICQYAGITTNLYRRLQKIPILNERFEVLAQRPEQVARRNVAQEIEAGCVPTSKWFLERKTKDYAPKQQVDHNITQVTDETAVLSTLEKLVTLSRQRAIEETERQADVIEMDRGPVDPLLM